MSLAYSGAEPQPSLAWSFESSNVDSVTSLKPSSQVSPGPAQLQGSAALVTTAPSGSNTAVSFDGTSGSYMNLGTASSAVFDNSTSNLFVECWVYVNATSANEQYVILRHLTGTPSGTDDWGLRYKPTGSFGFYSYGTSTSTEITSSASTGQWVHVAASLTTVGNMYLFINGGTPSTGSTPGTPRYVSGRTISIGTPAAVSNWTWSNMYIRDLRVVQGGVVPVTTFTPLASAPFSYASPTYVANMGTTVFTLLGQFITYVPGKYGSAVSITNYPTNGSTATSYIRYPLSTPISVDNGFTAAFWFKPATILSAGTAYPITIKGSSGDFTVYFFYNSSSQMSVVYYNGSFIGPSAVSYTAGTWYHMTGTILNGLISFYVNGSLTGTISYTPSGVTVNTQFYIGRGAYDGGVDMLMDDLRIYSTALTAAQVASVYSSQGAPAPSRAPPLPKYAWDFNGTTTDYINSLSPTTITGTIPYSVGKYRQSLQFTNVPGSAFTQGLLYNFPSTLDINKGITVTLWVNSSFIDANQQEFFRINMTSSSRFNFGVISSIGFFTQFTDASGTLTTLGSSATTDIWYHLAAVISQSSITFYKNGATAGGAACITTGLLTSGTFSVGYSTAVNTRGTAGSLDDLRIYDKALTSIQVQAIYNEQGTTGRTVNVYSGAEPQPSLAWSFESSNVDSVTSLKPSSQVSPGPGQLVGSAALVTNAPTSNTAVYFPGTINDYMNLETSTPTNFDASTSNVFFEAWINWADLTGQQRVYGRYANPQATSSINLYMRKLSNNTLEVSGGSGTTAINSTTLLTSVWYHIAFSSIPGGSSYVFVNGVPGTGTSLTYTTHNATYKTYIGSGASQYLSGYIRDLRVVQGGVVPVTTFTPGSAPFSYASPGYVASMGTTVFTLLGQFITYNPSGKYGSSIVYLNPKVGGSNVSNVITTWSAPISSNLYSIGLTVAHWVKFIALPDGDNRCVLWSVGDAYFNQFRTVVQSGMYSGSGFPGTYVGITTPTLGTWYHYTTTYGNGIITTYLNGSQIGATAGFSTARNLSNFSVIIGGDINGFATSAEYDDFRVYSTALTAAQVASVYSSQGVPTPARSTPLPRLAWNFDGTTTEYIINRAVSLRSGWTPTYGSGKYGKSLVFANQTGVTPPINDFNCTFPWTVNISQGFTVAFWVKIGISNNNYILHMANIGTGWGINFIASGVMYIDENATYPYNSQNYNFVLGQWCHVVLSIGGGVTYYKNGSVLGSPISYVPGTASVLQNKFWVGSDEYNGFNGELDDLRIYDKALTSAQVLSIYNTSGMPSRQVVSGAPIFSQLSKAASSSAVGAFSLRAVNGVTAKVVNVVPGGTFPPSAMTQTGTNSTTQTLGTGGKFQGSYIASSSRFDYGWGASGAFARSIIGYPTNLWQVGNYPVGGGTVSTPTTTTTGATNYNGEWLQFQTPFPINLTGYSVATSFLTSVVLLASKTGATSSWILVDSNSSITVGSIITNTGLNFAEYSYFRFVIITSTINYPALFNVQFFGTVPSLAQDFYADRLGNLLTAPIIGQKMVSWLGGSTGYVTTWYDQSGLGNHMAQTTAANQPVIGSSSLTFTGAEYFQNTVPFTFNFGSGAFTLRYVVSNNTGGLVLYKASKSDFLWNTGYEKKFWLGNGTAFESTRGGYPSQVGNSEGYSISLSAIGATKTSVVHKATSGTTVPIYINGTVQSLYRNDISMSADAGNFLYFGRGGGASNYIGNIHEIEIFSTAFSDADRLLLEN